MIDLEREIPPDIPWILRVDGHTDNRRSPARRLQVELGAVGRARHRGGAISGQQGGRPDRLAAAGFGEFQPLDQGTDDEALARNRRIELKLTER